MTYARNLVFSFTNSRAAHNERFEPGSVQDDYLHGLLNQVEDDARHRAAQQMRTVESSCDDATQCAACVVRMGLADGIDPYFRDPHGRLIRKSDGQNVIL